MTLSDFFDQVYVVNLERRKDRLANIESQKHIIGNYTRLHAVDCLVEKTKPGKPPYPGWSTISIGNYCNVLSQRHIIECMSDSPMLRHDFENVLILEDDVLFTGDFIPFLSAVPQNWDMLYFGGNHQEPLIPIDNIVGRCQFTLTAHAVAIKKHVGTEILHLTRHKNMPIDLYYAQLHKKYNVYCPLKGIATQINGYSDIESRETDYSAVIK